MSSPFLTQTQFERIFTSHLKIETYSKSIDSLFSHRSLNNINYTPYYQRNYVWDVHKATYFIESILLGTEIPPLIFFNNSTNIEVIDGRQRFETIHRFIDNKFSLTRNGLASLKQLASSTYDSLNANTDTASIIELFLDAKIRIIEFEIVNEPKLDYALEDKIKKEIFARYNSGITPLKKAEIDNAVYDSDSLFKYFKMQIRENNEVSNIINELFLSRKENGEEIDTGRILQFIRRYLVIHRFPIRYYAWGNNRSETLDKLYEHLANSTHSSEALYKNFIEKVHIIKRVKQSFTNPHTCNRLVCECLFWGLQVLDEEGIELSKFNDNNFINRLTNEITDKIENYTEIESNYYKQVHTRFSFTAELLQKEFNIILRAYVEGDKRSRDELKGLRKGTSDDDDTVTKLGELASLRVTKPEPSRSSIDDLTRVMKRNKFLVRPSYQRAEVISISKASSIIESILLDISLPPIFIYKRKDGTSEVIDGQQRLLTILGFIGEYYIDENNQRCQPKNSSFALKGLKILEKLNGKTYKDFKDYDLALQSKILDFEIFVVEIQESINPQFDPVDLFVRLNNKPYPIRENSFEMWNSWVEREVIDAIKEKVRKNKGWFYLKSIKGHNDRDRMENEELYTSLAFLEFHGSKTKDKDSDRYLYTYNRKDGISVRMSSSHDISRLLQNVSEDDTVKDNFLKAIRDVESFIKKTRLILIDKDVDDVESFLRLELDLLFKAQRQTRSFRRTKQNFYILWSLLSPLNHEMVKLFRFEIKEDLKNIFYVLRNNNVDNFSKESFQLQAQDFHAKYSIEKRQIKLSELEKNELLKKQQNRCPVSGALIFKGDEIEVDHIVPLAKGGKDSKENLQIVHKDSNRRKGVK